MMGLGFEGDGDAYEIITFLRIIEGAKGLNLW